MKNFLWVVIVCLIFNGCGAQLGYIPRESAATLPSSQNPDSLDLSPKKAISPKTHLIASGILAGVSLLGFIPAGILYSMDGQLTGDFCAVGEAHYPCHWNTTAGYAATFAISGIGLSSGLIWFIVTAIRDRQRPL